MDLKEHFDGYISSDDEMADLSRARNETNFLIDNLTVQPDMQTERARRRLQRRRVTFPPSIRSDPNGRMKSMYEDNKKQKELTKAQQLKLSKQQRGQNTGENDSSSSGTSIKTDEEVILENLIDLTGDSSDSDQDEHLCQKVLRPRKRKSPAKRVKKKKQLKKFKPIKTKAMLDDDVETIEFTIQDFEKQPEQTGEYIVSPKCSAHGHDWRIYLYPRGCNHAPTDTEYISCYTTLCDPESKEMIHDATLNLSCNRSKCLDINFDGDCALCRTNNFEVPRFLRRQTIVDECLEWDGSWKVKVEIRLQGCPRKERVWYPQKLLRDASCLERYCDEGLRIESSSEYVTFQVGQKLFPARMRFLFLRCKKLYKIATDFYMDRDDDEEIRPPIPILTTRRDIFRMLLEFVYTSKFPRLENMETTTAVLVAADTYSCSPLKLYAESVLVDKFLAPENTADLLLLAEPRKCALLKEAGIRWFVEDSKTIQETKAWAKVRESKGLLDQCLNSLVTSLEPKKPETRRSEFSELLLGPVLSNTEINRLDVGTLRNKLQRHNLEVEGSREELIERFKSYQSLL